MAKTLLGIDIGYDSLKLAVVSGGKVRRTAVAPMPLQMFRDDHVTSIEALGELIRNTMRENGIRCHNAALVLNSESVFVRNVTMPQMNAEQLAYNLPYEFRDYITGELRDYVYDYAMISSDQPGEEGGGKVMELLAVAAPGEQMEEMRAVMRKAGLKLVKAAPTVCSFIALIRQRQKNGGAPDEEYCFLDLGFRAVRMYMFRGEVHVATRELEVGLNALDDAIAEAYNVDPHLAHTYLLTNYDNCQEKEACVNSYNNISVELMRALNFYRFSNQDSQLSDIWLCGGGAAVHALQQVIGDALDMKIHQAGELVDGGGDLENCHTLLQAIGVTEY